MEMYDYYLKSNTTTSDPDVIYDNNTFPRLEITRDIIVGINIYGLPVIILLGILGNLMSFIVFAASHLRHHSSSVYLAFLNFADCLFLLCLLVTQLEWYHVFLLRLSGVCQLVVYFSYVSAFLSVWTVVSFTVERFIVVYFPLMRMKHCTRKRAAIIVVTLLVMALLLYTFALWTNSVQGYTGHKECLYLHQYQSMLHVISIVDTFLTMLIPSVVITVLNIMISVRVCSFLRKKRRESQNSSNPEVIPQDCHNTQELLPLNGITTGVAIGVERDRIQGACAENYTCRRSLRVTDGTPGRYAESLRSSGSSSEPRRSGSGSCSGTGSGSRTGSHQNTSEITASRNNNPRPSSQLSQQLLTSRSQALQLRTTRTLLIISSLFVILNLPSHAFRVWVTVKPPADVPSELNLLWQLTFQFLYYLNFSSNLWMYCACSKAFRRELRSMLGRVYDRILCVLCDCSPYYPTETTTDV